jgi:hypothetical protein
MDHEEACPSCPCISSAFATLGTWIDILSVLCFSALDFLYASFPFSTHCFCYVSWSMKVFLSSMLLRLVLAFLQVVGKNGRGSGCKSQPLTSLAMLWHCSELGGETLRRKTRQDTFATVCRLCSALYSFS